MVSSPKSMSLLPKSTVKLLGSAQVISSVTTVVKELIENAIDAGASSVEIKLENFGLDKIEVKDNGSGISEENVPFMCQKSYTSKINDFSDLANLESYGFRGEALFSLCAVSKVTITTKTQTAPIAKCYTFNNDGEIISTINSHISKGTIVIAENLFKNLPVRRQLMLGKTRSEEMKRVENLVKLLALVNHSLRFTLTHNKFMIWQKSGVHSITPALAQIIPCTIVRQLHELSHQDSMIKIKLLVPKKDCNVNNVCYGNSMDDILIFINNRPVKDKKIEKGIREEIYQYFMSKIPENKNPTAVALLEFSPNLIDVNLEPNKTKVFFKDSDKIVTLIRSIINDYYIGPLEPNMTVTLQQETPRKRNLDEESTQSSKHRKKSDDLIEVPTKPPLDDTINDFFDDDSFDSKLGEIHDCIESSQVQHNQDVSVLCETNFSPSTSSKFFDSSQEVTSEELFRDTADVSNKKCEPIASSTQQAMALDQVTLSGWSEGNFSLPGNKSLPSTTVLGVNVENNDLSTTKRTRYNLIDDENSELEFSDANSELPRDWSPDVETEPLKEIPEKLKLINNEPLFRDLTLSGWSGGDIKTAENKTLPSTTVVGINVRNECLSDATNKQLQQKKISDFTKYDDIRSHIIKQPPGVSFATVANDLKKKRKELQDIEEEEYKNVGKRERRRSKTKHYPTVVIIEDTLESIKLSIQKRNSTMENYKQIIGHIDNDLSVVQNYNSIFVNDEQITIHKM